MNKHLHNSLRALFLSLAVLLSLPMLAVEVEIDGINYELVVKIKEATVIAKSSGKYSGKVVIPESVEHEGAAYSVTSIGDNAFFDCSGLTSVTIPNSVTSIGDRAFAYCSGLTSVHFGNGVTSIGRGAFEGCSGLTSVHISDIAAWCNIDFAHFYSNPLYYAHHLYLNGEEVKDLVIPNSVASIGDYAFQYCSGLTSVIIPNSVTSIGKSAFESCSGLKSVTIGNSVTSIGDYAFFDCSGLTSVTIPNSVESIGHWAFRDCSGLTSVTIGNSVKSIGSETFAGCSKLFDVYCYAENVPSTERDVFTSSPIGTATLHVPVGPLDSYRATAPWSRFGKIVGISTEVDGINYDFDAETKQTTVIAKSSGKYSGEVVIPESVDYAGAAYSVTSIGKYAFSGCSGLTSVTIPNSVTSIGEEAFYGCSALASVTIPNSVKSIGDEAFCHCSGLTSVTIPNSVTSIGEEAFVWCSGLTSVTIGNSVKSIGKDAFYKCSGLTSVHISDIAAWYNIDFHDFESNPLYYAHHLYLNGEEVKDLVIPNSVTSIGDNAFAGCSGLTSVTIPNSVTSIGGYAFYWCKGLTSVTIPNSVTSIGYWAFANCPELLDVYCYAEKVPSTKSDAFDGSYPEYATLYVPKASVDSYKASAPWSSFGKIVALSAEIDGVNYDFKAETKQAAVIAKSSGKYSGEIVIPESVEYAGTTYSVTSIGDGAFYRCSVSSVTIPNSVTRIGNNAFNFCSGLTSVTIGNSVKSIGDWAFGSCSGLTSVTIGNSVESIGYYAFGSCSNLHDVYCYAENVPSTNSNAFSLSPIANATLHVPDGSIDSYKATEPWIGFGKIVALGEEETGIDEVKGENGKVKTAVYDLSGRRVQKAQKGIFIQNGKLMVK